MSFTDKIKAEILSKPIKETHCKKAFIAGLIPAKAAAKKDPVVALRSN